MSGIPFPMYRWIVPLVSTVVPERSKAQDYPLFERVIWISL